MFFIIAYDITDSKRLQKMHRNVSKFATAIEYSVFVFEGTELALTRNMSKLKKIINQKKDDLRCYPLPENLMCEKIGKNNEEGIFFSGIPKQLWT